MAKPSWIRGKLLGAGAFGSVNLAIHREHGAVFAAKSVVVDANSELAVRAIENEITLLQALDSEFVVRCLGSDWTEENGQQMRNVFLEYMPEGCLTDFVNQFATSGALDEHLLRTYTRSVVEGIAYLHSRGIVHCDIKGKNILVGNGSVKLTDFGSAKRVTETTVVEDVNCSVNGTPLWMAPEVVRQVEQGLASDIWSLGCTVVEMATGRAPWSNLAGMNQLVAMYHIGCSEDLPEVPGWLSPEARDFLSHCLERDPRRRWTSAQLLEHPFLTTRFVECSKQPAYPTSVMQFPVDEGDNHSSVDGNTVFPTLAAPAPLFGRKLAQVQVQVLVEENWWNSPPGSPDSGPWIVVRSPKCTSLPSSSSSDSMTPVSDPLSLTSCECEDSEPSCEVSEIMVVRESSVISGSCTVSETGAEQSCVVSASCELVSETVVEQSSVCAVDVFPRSLDHESCASMDPVVAASDACDGLNPLILLASGLVDCSCSMQRFGESEGSSSYDRPADLENLEFGMKDGYSIAALSVGLSVKGCASSECSVLLRQYFICAQILLYWWQCYRGWGDYWKLCGRSDQRVLQLLDEYTFALVLETTSCLAIVCACVYFL